MSSKMPSPKPKLKLASSTKAASKETIYIDVEDEITSIIDKVTSSKSSIVAVVLPKRATVMQSIVNMKLLKQTTEDAGKHVVLVTSEATLMPLAGMTGMYVAATPTSKPGIPATDGMPSDEAESIDEPLPVTDGTDSEEDDFDPDAAAATPVGVLAAQEPESILMSEDDAAADAGEPTLEDKVAATTVVTKPNKKLKVPSFNKFRLGMVLGVLALLLLAGALYAALVVLPKAGVAITTNSSTLNSELNLTLDTAATKLDTDKAILPAVAQSSSKAYTQEVPATGQQNVGKKATGSVKLTTKVCAPHLSTTPDNLPAGSGVSAGNHTYITQETGKYSISDLSGSCITYSTQSIDITALKAGAEYNAPSGTNFSATDGSTGTGSTSGGTDEIVKVVSQTDIDAAKTKISQEDTSAIRQTLSDRLKAKDMMPVDSTFLAGDQQVTTSANAGDKADTVKVTATVPYTMLGVKSDDLKTLVLKKLDDKVDTTKQNIADDGVAKAKFSQENPGTPTSAVVLAKVKTVIGPKLDAASIREKVAGKKAGEIKDILTQTPGVTDVEVMYSPFWVNKAPKDTRKITIVIDGETK